MSDSQTLVQEAVDDAIKAAGNQVTLASKLSDLMGKPIKTGHIYYWRNNGSVPSEYCAQIEAITGVSRSRLRPDDYWLIWPDLPAPEEAAQQAA
jgi:hypothetical protein